ncbi:amidase [Nocardia goodfellowii]|uniref:amidase n=1 Tax=Nocardia goodfellowii TaxID=882446 RepID=A0ABS4QJY0_9NOCA|nr:amidase family protein [Nocardia goodfellowii]MBP2191349.1 Asp-tRNA(Asn)/Glu-tRNA(Gln) amidotransferase A subunit family amidase [Nocardia goodfellowii]
MRTDEYLSYDALGLAQLVQAGDVTPRELLEVARQQARMVNPRINAVVRFMAAEAEHRVDQELVGPFAGIPFLIKDLAQDYAGLPSSCGSRSLAQLPAREHSFGAKGITEPDLFGPTRNPWDLDRTPGGSSGGSAAAVAAGIVPAAGANDGGGSIRIPAACCGLVGLKPGRGLVPMGPAIAEMMHGAAAQGVVTRTVRDTAAMLDVVKGGELSGPYLPAVPAETFLSQIGADPGRLRIGICTFSAINPAPHAEARTAVEVAGRALADLGHTVEILDKPPVDDHVLAQDFLLTWFSSLAWEVEDAKRRSGCGDEGFEFDTRLMAALGRACGSLEYIDVVMRRHDHTRRLSGFYDNYDLLVTPTLADLPPLIGSLDTPRPLRRAAEVLLTTHTAGLLRHTKLLDQIIDNNLSWTPYTQLANVTGRPAMSLPLHWSADAIPIGVQFTAQLGGEAMMVRLAAQLEQAVPWIDRRPPVCLR